MMPPDPCTKKQLQGTDLSLIEIKPTSSATDPEQRFRCPVAGCPYIGSTLGHPGDCLRHLLDSKGADGDAHKKMFAGTLVTFLNAEGKPVLNSKASTQPAFVFGDGRVTKPQCAYMKVCVEARPLFDQTKQDGEQFLCAGGGQVQCV